ncbi:MAG: YqeG family HAD IIIA-type phosphatase [Ruminococcus sp.]|nr:YqeG family HAD IIIA-type phosphatase [Ruminococcus sp.]
MFIFEPTYVFDKITDITPDILRQKRVKGLILDLDNTLTTHNNPVVPKSSLEWVSEMKAAGIKLMIVSNNHAPRVEPFAEQLDLEFVCEGKKPLTFGYNMAVRKMALDKANVAAVGDQIFTDILGSNLCGIRSFFVFPIQPETSLPFRFKRAVERPLLPKRPITNTDKE